MAVATFDTLKFANTLKAAGVPAEQAEAQARAFAEVIQVNLGGLVSKDDLSTAQAGTDRQFKELREYVDRQFQALRADTDRQFEELRAELGQLREYVDQQLTELREHVDRQFKALRTEMEQQGKELRAEVAQQGKELRAEMAQQGKELRAELALEGERQRHKIAEEVQAVNARHDAFLAKYAGDMALVKWMLAAILTIGGGILVRLFFRSP